MAWNRGGFKTNPRCINARRPIKRSQCVRVILDYTHRVRKLNHQHIVRYLGVTRLDDEMLIVLEYVTKGSLSGMIGSLKLDNSGRLQA